MKKDSSKYTNEINTSEYKRLFGDRLRAAREKAGMSQLAFASKSGISNPYLSQIENGQRNPSLLIIHNICHENHLSTDDLFFGPSEKSDALEYAYANIDLLSDERLNSLIDYLIGIRALRKSLKK